MHRNLVGTCHYFHIQQLSSRTNSFLGFFRSKTFIFGPSFKNNILPIFQERIALEIGQWQFFSFNIDFIIGKTLPDFACAQNTANVADWLIEYCFKIISENKTCFSDSTS